ncbi:MAG: hypothetical protein ACOCP8_09290, partial [archaeon]
MVKKVLLTLISILLLSTFAFSADSTLQCEFKSGSCDAGEVALLYANEEFYPPGHNDKVLSSNVAIAQSSNYNKLLCCKSDFGSLNVEFVNSQDSCPSGFHELMHFTDDTNARTGFKRYEMNNYIDFNLDFYTKKSCLQLPPQFATVHLVVSDEDYQELGYECLYRTSSLENGHVSSCDAEFADSELYDYTVWARLDESTSSLNCNSDCISILTNRINYECGFKLDRCKDVPVQCHGSLLSTWMNFNETHEILCNLPWNQ